MLNHHLSARLREAVHAPGPLGFRVRRIRGVALASHRVGRDLEALVVPRLFLLFLGGAARRRSAASSLACCRSSGLPGVVAAGAQHSASGTPGAYVREGADEARVEGRRRRRLGRRRYYLPSLAHGWGSVWARALRGSVRATGRARRRRAAAGDGRLLARQPRSRCAARSPCCAALSSLSGCCPSAVRATPSTLRTAPRRHASADGYRCRFPSVLQAASCLPPARIGHRASTHRSTHLVTHSCTIISWQQRERQSAARAKSCGSLGTPKLSSSRAHVDAGSWPAAAKRAHHLHDRAIS